MLMKAEKSCLLIVDIQERLARVVGDPNKVVANADLLIGAARRLSVPVLASEQYPKGIGHTVPALSGYLHADDVFEKLHFSAAADPVLGPRLTEMSRRQIVVCGLEAHVCVLQTVIDLVEAGFETFVVADATSSRRPENHAAAIERMRAAGAWPVTTEMVVFEWLEKAGTADFKELSARIR